MKVIAIFAVSKRRVIGYNNRLPWHAPEDLRFFRETTVGKVVIMGRKTFESLNRPKGLPNRFNIVISTSLQQEDDSPTLMVCHSLQQALSTLKTLQKSECYLIGGAQLFSHALREGSVDEVLLTTIEEEVDGDVYLPSFEHQFVEVSNRKSEIDPRLTFKRFIKR